MFLKIDNKSKDSIAAINEAGETLLYGELVEWSHAFQDALSKRSLVFALCKNVIGSLVGYVSLLASGNVPLLLSADMDKNLLKELVDVYKPSYIWVPVEMKKDMEELLRVKESISLNGRDEVHGYCMLSMGSSVVELYEGLALLLTTSGSTGSPKLVRQTYNNIESNAESIAEYLELDDTERPITTLPMNYTYGLSIINSHLLVGATLLMTESTYAQRDFWEFFKKEHATSIAGVPYTYEILKKLRFFRMDLPSLRYMTQAGGKFYLIDIDGNNIEAPHIVGELVYEGPNVTLGYAQCQSDLSKGDERGGRLVTGDMAKRDEEGFYYIVGRKKRFLKIYGNRVNLDECERMLQSEYEYAEFACVGEDDNMRIYTTKEGIEKEVVEYIAHKTGLNFKAFQVKHIDTIPKNESGKKNYAGL